MDWNNVNLKSSYERSQNILDSLDFDTLLLEISCNLRTINKETVKAHFMESLNAKIESANEVFNANLDNIINDALEYRNNN